MNPMKGVTLQKLIYKDILRTNMYFMSSKSERCILVKHNDYQEEEVDCADPESGSWDPQVLVTTTVTDLDRAEGQTTVQRRLLIRHKPTPSSCAV